MRGVILRPADVRDLPAILDIYNDAILTSTATFDVEPQTLEEKRRWLLAHGPPYAVIVAERDGRVLGFASLGPFRAKAAYRFSAENSVYVRKDLQGRGTGKLLLARLLEIAHENGFRTVISRIAGENRASERLHRACGFRTVGVERQVGYKFGQWLHVLVMQKLLPAPPDGQ